MWKYIWNWNNTHYFFYFCCHCTFITFLGYNIINGIAAVQCFYMFSGFYMFMILSEKYISTKKFYKSRFLRIYPIYFFIAIPTLLFIYLSGNFQDIWNSADIFTKIFITLSNICIYTQDIVMFLAVDPQNGSLYFTTRFSQEPIPLYKLLIIPQAWTLGVELTFYILAPFLVKRKTATLFIILILSIIIRIYALKIGYYRDPWNYRFFPFELSLFLCGAISYRIYYKIRIKKFMDYISPIITLLLIIAILIFQFIPLELVKKLFIYYIITAISIPFIFHSSRNSKIDRAIGELSYPIYIIHISIIWILYYFFNSYMEILNKKQLLCVPVIILSILFSILINKYIQRPIDNMRRR